MNVFPLPAFRQIVEDLSTFPIIYADQNAPREVKPYATIKLRSSVGNDQAELFDLREDGTRDIEENNVASLELNFYGPSAISEATRVRNKLMFENTTDLMCSNNVSIVDRGTVTNLTVLLSNSQYEQRAMFELRAGWRSTETETLAHIENVDIAGILTEGTDPNTPVTQNIDVQLQIVFD